MPLFVEKEYILSLCYLGQVSFDVLMQEPERRMYQWSLMRQEQPDGKYVWPYQADMEEIPQRQGEQPRPVSGLHVHAFLPYSCISAIFMYFCHHNFIAMFEEGRMPCDVLGASSGKERWDRA